MSGVQAYEFVEFVNNYLDRLVLKLEKKKSEYVGVYYRDPITGLDNKLYLYFRNILISVFGDGDSFNAIRQIYRNEQKGDQKVPKFFDLYTTTFLITKLEEDAADKFTRYVFYKAYEAKLLPKADMDRINMMYRMINNNKNMPPEDLEKAKEEVVWATFDKLYRIGNEKKDSSERYPSQISLKVPIIKNTNRFRDGVEIVEFPINNIIKTNNWFVKRNQVCSLVLFCFDQFRVYNGKFVHSCDIKRIETTIESMTGPITIVPPSVTLTSNGFVPTPNVSTQAPNPGDVSVLAKPAPSGTKNPAPETTTQGPNQPNDISQPSAKKIKAN